MTGVCRAWSYRWVAGGPAYPGAPGQPGVPACHGGELAGRGGRGQSRGGQLAGVPGHVQPGDAGDRVHPLLPAPGQP
jgi:hypothetical protein